MAINRQAIAKAHSRLRVAKKAVADLVSCRDFDSFTDVWYQFLTAAKNIYNVLTQGAKNDPKARQWMGARNEFREKDELLQYIFQARNDDEHGLEPIAEHVPGSLEIGVPREGYSQSVFIDNISMGDDGVLKIGEIRSHDGRPVLIENIPSRVRLIAVRDREGNLYDPPTKHMGKPIVGNSPLAVATLAITYLESLVGEAERLS